jgi:hypothetical protein
MKLLSTLASIVLLSVACNASGEQIRCTGTRIQVPDWSAEERKLVCGAAAAAIAYLRGVGLAYSNGLTIRALPKAGDQDEPQVIGRCNVPGNEILVLNYDASLVASRKYPPAFGMPMSVALWQSFISHETAHAVAEQNFALGVRRPTASEYIAAVVQLVTLPPDLRQAILDRYDVAGFGDAREISMDLYEMNPAVFAVMAYRHYAALGDRGPAFIARLLREGLDQ